MNARVQIIIDNVVAKPIAFLLNFLVRIVGKVLRIDHRLDRPFKTIVVCKFKGMGSIIQASPMLNALKSAQPQAKLIFVSTTSNTAILRKIDAVDEIVTINDKSLITLGISMVKALFTLIRQRPGVYIDLEIYSDFSTIFALSTLATNRIGFYLRSSAFRKDIYTHMLFFSSRKAVAEVYMQVAALLGYQGENTELTSLQPGEHSPRGNPYIVINPNASDLRIERRWPAANFVALIQKIRKEVPSLDIFLIGSKEEYPYTQTIVAACDDDKVQNLAGKTNIDTLVDTIAHAKSMISNDTGPMHIAFATKTPIVCLFGPCHPDQYGVSEVATILYKPTYCSPCVHDFIVPPCKGNNICMQAISVEEVFQKFKEINGLLALSPA